MEYRVIRETVEKAIVGARVDINCEPDEQVEFVPSQLDAVVKLFRHPPTRQETLAAANEALREHLIAMDAAAPEWHDTKAALALTVRLEAQVDRTYRQGADGTLELVDERPLRPED